jgi:hypothetical protein
MPNYLSAVRSLVVFTAILFAIVTPAMGQGEKSIRNFEGTWVGSGKSMGMTSSMQLKWEWVLDQKFLRLTLNNEMQSSGGQKQNFAGHAYYQPSTAGDKFTAQWFDSRGISFPITGSFDGTTLTSDWGSPDKEEGRSIYKLIDAETMEVVDSVKLKDGTWREFGRATVKRQK